MKARYLIFLLLLSSCLAQNTTKQIPATQTLANYPTETARTPDPNPAQTSTPTPLPESPPLSPTPPISAPEARSQYTITAVLNYAQHYLAVDEQITYINRSGETLANLILMVEPLNYAGVFRLNGIAWQEGQPIENYEFKNSQLHIPLRQVLGPGERVELSLSYELNLPSPTPSAETRPVPFGYTARQTNLVDWYPFVAPYKEGQGWLAHQAGFFGEHLVYDVADFDVSIRLADSRSDLTIAASGEAEKQGEWHHYTHTAARNFAWSVSHEYIVTEQQVDDVIVRGYAFPYHQNAGETALKTTAEALALYEKLFSPYPRQLLSVVEADFLDGMEYDGMYFLSNGFYNLYQGTPGEFLVAIAAHETAHQWFYALVGNDQALEPWLDEALCTYSERLYFEHYFPEALDWWWTYRVRYYQPRGWVDGSIYNPGGYRAYRDAVYLNGAIYLEELRKLVGETAFFSLLQSYVTEYSYQIASGEDFFALLPQFTTPDYNSLSSNYFQNQ
ncbi:MAG TPA: M1 family metallopeptidase [Anaerolineales bacterium]|nr:M1 family metallopeptidase [Anaerolineales bacterium]